MKECIRVRGGGLAAAASSTVVVVVVDHVIACVALIPILFCAAVAAAVVSFVSWSGGAREHLCSASFLAPLYFIYLVCCRYILRGFFLYRNHF